MSSTGFLEQSSIDLRLPPDQRPSVLVTEDDPALRDAIVIQLMELGIVPTVASGPANALRIASRERPDLILLDGLLAEIHASEIAGLLRHLEKGYRPRIVLVTGNQFQWRQNAAHAKAGIDDYLVKPVSTERLSEVIFQARKEQ